MNKHIFFPVAQLLVVAALLTHSVARVFLEEAMHRKGARISEAVQKHTQYVADPLAAQASHVWKVLTAIGVAVTVMSVACAVAARLRQERGWYLFWALLLVFAVAAPLLL